MATRSSSDRSSLAYTTAESRSCWAASRFSHASAALVAKPAAGKLLRGRKLRVDTTVVEADIDYPTDADLLEQAVSKLGGLVRRSKARGAASRTRFRDRGRAVGRRMRQLARTLRRRTGVAMGEGDRLTGEVAAIARQSLREVQAGVRNARGGLARRPGDGRLGWLVGELEETISQPQRLPAQTDQRLAGNRVIPDRLVSLSDPDARPIRTGKPKSPTEFGDTLLVAEDERGFVCDHQLQRGRERSAGCATGGSGSRRGSATSSAHSGWVAPGCAACRAPRPGSGSRSSPTTCSG
jgi:transposase, IS5 family